MLVVVVMLLGRWATGAARRQLERGCMRDAGSEWRGVHSARCLERTVLSRGKFNAGRSHGRSLCMADMGQVARAEQELLIKACQHTQETLGARSVGMERGAGLEIR